MSSRLLRNSTRKYACVTLRKPPRPQRLNFKSPRVQQIFNAEDAEDFAKARRGLRAKRVSSRICPSQTRLCALKSVWRQEIFHAKAQNKTEGVRKNSNSGHSPVTSRPGMNYWLRFDRLLATAGEGRAIQHFQINFEGVILDPVLRIIVLPWIRVNQKQFFIRIRNTAVHASPDWAPPSLFVSYGIGHGI